MEFWVFSGKLWKHVRNFREIHGVNEKLLIQKRIEEVDERSANILLEKQKMHDRRLEIRKQLEKEKETMMKNFQKAKKHLDINEEPEKSPKKIKKQKKL